MFTLSWIAMPTLGVQTFKTCEVIDDILIIKRDSAPSEKLMFDELYTFKYNLIVLDD